MAPSKKEKASGISATSFLDLKAELSQKEAEFSKNKAAGKSVIVGGVQRPEKKPRVWARANKGVADRSARDMEIDLVSRPTIESARAILERKAKKYDQLKKGKSGGLSDAQYDALLVDFDSKPFEPDSGDDDESLTVPQNPNDEQDPVIEYEDEFGRVRTARRSEVPRELLPKERDELSDDDEDIVIHNPVNHYPVYEPSAERLADIEKEYAETNNPLTDHYDASREVRAKGAGFYQFSADEETRRAQMAELRSARDETETTRKEMGAVDVRPGEVEGMQAPIKNKALEKRKRDIEERRRLVDAKRKKITATPGTASLPSSHVQPKSGLVDPFAALEASTSGQTHTASEADDFLAQLTEDFKHRRS